MSFLGLILLALAGMLAGCGPKTAGGIVAPEDPAAAPQVAARPGWPIQSSQSSVLSQGRQLPSVPNSLQLPRVSPNGQWIAYLKNDDPSPPNHESLVTGRGLSAISLWVRSINSTRPRIVLGSGACWATWSVDGKKLFYISYDARHRCSLGIHDLASGRSRLLAAGVRHMMMLAPSPSGTHLAVSTYGELPEKARIFIIDLTNGEARPGPMATGGPQLWPHWLDDQTLLYVTYDKDDASLRRWTVSTQHGQTVMALKMPHTVFGAMRLFASVSRPLSSDLRHLAYYEMEQDRLAIADLATARIYPMNRGFQAGTWLGADKFLATSSQALESHSIPPGSGAAGSVKVWPGSCIPLWTDTKDHHIIFVSLARNPSVFKLTEMWLAYGKQ